MIAHQITLEWSDGAAELLALDFNTGRIIVRWGSGLVSHVCAYHYLVGEPEFTGWRRETAPHGYRIEALAGAAGDRLCRPLGRMDDTITARPVFDPLARAVAWLRDASPRYYYPHSRALARAVAGWLLGMRSTLANAHGCDLLDALAGLNVGNGTIDDMLGELVRLGAVYPHACMPRTDAILTHDTHANMRACFAGRFVLGSALPNVWAEHTAGAKHWLYQCGPKWEACTGVRSGYQTQGEKSCHPQT